MRLAIYVLASSLVARVEVRRRQSKCRRRTSPKRRAEEEITRPEIPDDLQTSFTVFAVIIL